MNIVKKSLLTLVIFFGLAGCADMMVGGVVGCGLGYAFTGTGVGCARTAAGGAALAGAYRAYVGGGYGYSHGYEDSSYGQSVYNYQLPPEKPCDVYSSAVWDSSQQKWIQTAQSSCHYNMDSPPPILPPPVGMPPPNQLSPSYQ